MSDLRGIEEWSMNARAARHKEVGLERACLDGEHRHFAALRGEAYTIVADERALPEHL